MLILNAALGTVPPNKSAEKNKFRSDAQTWFKSFKGGREPTRKSLASEYGQCCNRN